MWFKKSAWISKRLSVKFSLCLSGSGEAERTELLNSQEEKAKGRSCCFLEIMKFWSEGESGLFMQFHSNRITVNRYKLKHGKFHFDIMENCHKVLRYWRHKGSGRLWNHYPGTYSKLNWAAVGPALARVWSS